MKNHFKIFIGTVLFVVGFSTQSWGQKEVRTPASAHYKPTFTYDLGASTGTYNNLSYTEITVGLNWYLLDYLVWRNAIFSRFGSQISTIAGLDSSIRFVFDAETDNSKLGIGFFAGPGYRFSDTNDSGVFGEAGVVLKAVGLAIGVGVKSLIYNNPGTNPDGSNRPKQDNVIFIILAGGGAF